MHRSNQLVLNLLPNVVNHVQWMQRILIHFVPRRPMVSVLNEEDFPQYPELTRLRNRGMTLTSRNLTAIVSVVDISRDLFFQHSIIFESMSLSSKVMLRKIATWFSGLPTIHLNSVWGNTTNCNTWNGIHLVWVKLKLFHIIIIVLPSWPSWLLAWWKMWEKKLAKRLMITSCMQSIHNDDQNCSEIQKLLMDKNNSE